MSAQKKKNLVTNKLSIDLETTGLNFKKDSIVCVGAQIGDSKIYIHKDDYSNEKSFRIAIENAIYPIIDKGCELTFHNSKFDMKFLWKLLGKQRLTISHDTMLMAYVLSKRPIKLSLDSLASYYLGIPSWKDDFKQTYIFANKELLKIYCQNDVEITLKLADLLEERLKKENRWEFYVKLMEICNLLLQVEFTGILFDKEKAQNQIEEFNKELALLDDKLQKKFPKVNWNSPKQVLALFQSMNLNVIHPLTNKKSTDIRVIRQNLTAAPILADVVKFKETKKKIGSIKGYIEDNCDQLNIINPNFNAASTSTGRLSSSGPNLQQVDKDKRIRSLFVPMEGNDFVIGDMAQIEVRMAAHYSKDPALMKMFADNLDFYGTIATGVLKVKCHPNEVKEKHKNMRDVSKVIGLSILYGTGAFRLMTEIKEKTGIEYTLQEVKQIINNYFETFKELKTLRQGVDQTLNSRGYIVNLLGRPVDIKAADIYMTGVNALLQSSASDLLLFRQLEIEKILTEQQIDANLLALIHDETIYESSKKDSKAVKKILTSTMENDIVNGVKLRVPLKFECVIGENWSIKD